MADQPAAPAPAAAPQSSIMQYKELIMAVTAMMVAGGGWLKPPDTTAAETSHAIHDAEFERMEAHLAKQHHDLRNLRKFIAGYVKAQYEAEQAKIKADEAAPRSRRRGAPPPRRRLRPPPSLPSLSAAPKAVEHRGFGEVLDMNDQQMMQMMQDIEVPEEIELPPEFEYPELPELPDGPPDGPPF